WKGWMERFHGVATRYLNHYLGWHRMLDAVGDSVTPHSMLGCCPRACISTLNDDIALANAENGCFRKDTNYWRPTQE
ncbi:MAG: hypothetical protein PF501_11840, partial [Salinisphaera sp.]|nr:hypothetical protein [Salinisphaera sp.]